ncbi:hypothetical protein ACFCWB_34260 [Streptomyces bacillaris]|uniref:hypothetical protein n=1 Tax=Streptomyces bacillaris TaxID=68179 RepID=UPI0035DEF00A
MTAPEPADTAEPAEPNARERLRGQRAHEARRARRRRLALRVAAAAAVAAGLLHQRGSEVRAAAEGQLVVPSTSAGPDRTTLVYGRQDAPRVVAVAMDPGCRPCAATWHTVGPALRGAADRGTHRLEFAFGTSLDRLPGDAASQRALNALAAAADEGQAALADRLAAWARDPEHLTRPADLRFVPWARKASAAVGDRGAHRIEATLDGAPLDLSDGAGALAKVLG